MRVRQRTKSLIPAILGCLLSAFSARVEAAPPALLSFQGAMQNDDGSPITGTISMTLRIYESATGGSHIYQTIKNVPFSDTGGFSTFMGDTDPLILRFDRPYFIAVSIDGGVTELSPRLSLTTVPYSFYARVAADLAPENDISFQNFRLVDLQAPSDPQDAATKSYVDGQVANIVGPQGPQGPAGNDGRTILSGTTNPLDSLGSDGDLYLNTASSEIFGPKASGTWGAGVSLVGAQGPQGPQGAQGIQGIQGIQGPTGATGSAGADGRTVLSGTSDPIDSLGTNGDFYINTATSHLFGPKASDTWPTGVSLVGAQGAQGPQGPQGIQGIQGIQGNPGSSGADGRTVLSGTADPIDSLGANGDFYINTTTSFLFGPKASDTWPAGVSLVGAQGADGPQGPQGIQGIQGIQGDPGPSGADGRTVLSGTSDPIDSLGANGDFYVNTTTSFLFGPKASDTWPAGVSLVGAQGAQGPQGPQGIQGIQGIQGNPGSSGADGRTVLSGAADPIDSLGANGDFYINTTTSFLFGPKASDTWPAGVSLVGAQGPQGPQGPQGIQGIQGPSQVSTSTLITTGSLLDFQGSEIRNLAVPAEPGSPGDAVHRGYVTSKVGDLTSLATTEKSSAVGAINFLAGRIGDGFPLPTLAQDLSGAILELTTSAGGFDPRVGNRFPLPKGYSTLSAAVHQIATLDIGSNFPLPTSTQTLSGAITEITTQLNNQDMEIGGAFPLPTSAQSLSGAITEVATNLARVDFDLGPNFPLPAVHTSVSDAIHRITTEWVGGNFPLPTSAQTLSGGLTEIATNQARIDTDLGTHFPLPPGFANLSQAVHLITTRDIGNEFPLPTFAQTLSGGVTEVTTNLQRIDLSVGPNFPLPGPFLNLSEAVHRITTERIGVQFPLPTSAQTVSGGVTELATNLARIDFDVGPHFPLPPGFSSLSEAVHRITTLDIGSNFPLPTGAQTLSGAVTEIATQVDNQNNEIGDFFPMPTFSQNLSGAITEIATGFSQLNTRVGVDFPLPGAIPTVSEAIHRITTERIGTAFPLPTGVATLSEAFHELTTQVLGVNPSPVPTSTIWGAIAHLKTTDIGVDFPLPTEAMTLSGAVHELSTVVGDVSELNTFQTSSVVAAVNELHFFLKKAPRVYPISGLVSGTTAGTGSGPGCSECNVAFFDLDLPPGPSNPRLERRYPLNTLTEDLVLPQDDLILAIQDDQLSPPYRRQLLVTRPGGGFVANAGENPNVTSLDQIRRVRNDAQKDEFFLFNDPATPPDRYVGGRLQDGRYFIGEVRGDSTQLTVQVGNDPIFNAEALIDVPNSVAPNSNLGTPIGGVLDSGMGNHIYEFEMFSPQVTQTTPLNINGVRGFEFGGGAYNSLPQSADTDFVIFANDSAQNYVYVRSTIPNSLIDCSSPPDGQTLATFYPFLDVTDRRSIIRIDHGTPPTTYHFGVIGKDGVYGAFTFFTNQQIPPINFTLEGVTNVSPVLVPGSSAFEPCN